ncbi:MAG TPA: TonB family protein [Chthoniobacterales bacterium]|nr:TonB family protein [Chthoniobacterales bacterium]
MTPALLYRSRHNWRFTAALFAAAAIHVGVISLATTRQAEPRTASGFSTEPPGIILEPTEPIADQPPDATDPLPTPPVIDQPFIEPTAIPPPVHRTSRFTPVVRPRSSTMPGSMRLSSAKVFAVSAPRPEYPYEARRQRVTGDGIALLTIDPGTGNVVQATMTKSTGNQFLDSAAISGFKRWRFKPGTVSWVTCPITFTLTGASY